jgi:hypothetical protein
MPGSDVEVAGGPARLSTACDRRGGDAIELRGAEGVAARKV